MGRCQHSFPYAYQSRHKKAISDRLRFTRVSFELCVYVQLFIQQGDSLDISDASLAVLPELKNLQILVIENCPRITDVGLRYVSQITGLKALKLKANAYVTSSGLAQLDRLKSLEILNLGVGSQAADAALDKLQSLPLLRELELEYWDWAPAGPGLRHLAGFARLESLELSGHYQPMDQAMAELPTLPHVKTLRLARCGALTAAGLKNLEKFPNLEALELDSRLGVDRARVAEMARLSKLRMFVIKVDRVNRQRPAVSRSLSF